MKKTTLLFLTCLASLFASNLAELKALNKENLKKEFLIHLKKAALNSNESIQLRDYDKFPFLRDVQTPLGLHIVMRRFDDVADFYLSRVEVGDVDKDGRKDYLVLIGVVPRTQSYFLCSSSFKAIQNGKQYDVMLMDKSGNSFCDDLYISSAFLVVNWSFDKTFKPYKNFTLLYETLDEDANERVYRWNTEDLPIFRPHSTNSSSSIPTEDSSSSYISHSSEACLPGLPCNGTTPVSSSSSSTTGCPEIIYGNAEDYFNDKDATCLPGTSCNNKIVFTKETVTAIINQKLEECKKDLKSCGINAIPIINDKTPLKQILPKLANKSFDFKGHYFKYGNGAFDWIYVSKNYGVYKLEKGLNEDYSLRWTTLHTPNSPHFKEIKIKNNKVTFGPLK